MLLEYRDQDTCFLCPPRPSKIIFIITFNRKVDIFMLKKIGQYVQVLFRIRHKFILAIMATQGICKAPPACK